MRTYLLLLIITCTLSACNQFPKDPANTLETVSDGVLKVGYSENMPWVEKGQDQPNGLEADLLREFAKSLNAQIEWHNDTEQNLFEKLEKKELHVVIAGITADNPWKKRVAFSRPYLEKAEKKHVMAAIRGENAFVFRLEKFLHHQQNQLQNQQIHETN